MNEGAFVKDTCWAVDEQGNLWELNIINRKAVNHGEFDKFSAEVQLGILKLMLHRCTKSIDGSRTLDKD